MKKTQNKTNVEWVHTKDAAFYDMDCVHPKNDKDFNSPRRFHFYSHEDAVKFFELIQRCHCATSTKKQMK